MLGNSTVVATLAVKDVNTAKKFYGETLGLKVNKEIPDGGGVLYDSGSGQLFVYQSAVAGTNQATAASWEVDDVEGTVNELKGKGVIFEHYDDLPNTKREGDLHIMGPYKAAWFKDPDGNILNVATPM